MSRLQVSKRTRFEIFKRDGFVCQYCGAHPPDVLLHCDHIFPVALGGTNEPDNLITSCSSCNLGKSDVPLVATLESLPEKAARVAEMEQQIAGYEGIMRERRMRIEADADEVFDFFCTVYGKDRLPNADFISMKRFVERLGLDETLEAAEIAAHRFRRSYRTAFKYFCGVCWNKLRSKGGEV